ncbi:translation elongation factor 2 [Auriscalpium vulgare]|uniref:Translation elongation factor 2 n=1 Tax=Auriscalpium vulgare TaxID=40419 RepID=A0ACB8S926_9AGAM|nr:translation elongation factor 2 [Auriscalpium vulgare]
MLWSAKSCTVRHDPLKTRNLAVVAHIDSGKTTLTESVLLKSSYLTTSGSVDTGSTTTDFLPAERERGITIQSASIPVHWKHWTYNLIDTPGHADFGMEVESASRVVDGAIVLIDSVEGVEAQTKGVWQQLDRYGVSTRILFMNKLDRPGASYHSSLLSTLSHRIHPKPMVLTVPVASFDAEDYARAEPGIQGIVDLVKWELWKWAPDGTSSRRPLPTDADALSGTGLFQPNHPMVAHLPEARAQLVENLAMHSDELMEHILDLPSSPSAYLTVPPATLLPHLRAATLRSDILPVVCGSAIRHIGTEIVLDYAGELLASPVDVSHTAQTSKSPVRALAWKVAWDKKKGWMTFVRVYSGTVTRQSVLMNSTRNAKERVSKLLLLYASETHEVDELPFGSVGVILGLKETRTGDTLVSTRGSSDETSPMGNIIPPPAVMSASVIPQSHADLEPVEQALHALSRTDPSVRIEAHEGQILVHGLGALHLEIVEGRLRDEWGTRFEFGKRRVSYREGLGPPGAGPRPSDVWTATVGGKSVATSVSFKLRPLEDDEDGDPAWEGNVVLREDGRPLLSPDAFFDAQDPFMHISRGIASALSNSPHTALPLSRIHVEVSSFSYPPDVSPSVLAGASSIILRNEIRARAMGPLMEPFIQLRISVGEETLGKVVKDLTEQGGEVLDMAGATISSDGDATMPYPREGVYVPPKWMSPSTMGAAVNADIHALRLRRSVTAVAPLSRMLDFSTRLRALSGGHGHFEMSGEGFRTVNHARQQEILREIGRA